MRALFNHIRSKVSRIDDNHEIDPADTSNTSSGNIGTKSANECEFNVLLLLLLRLFFFVFVFVLVFQLLR